MRIDYGKKLQDLQGLVRMARWGPGCRGPGRPCTPAPSCQLFLLGRQGPRTTILNDALNPKILVGLVVDAQGFRQSHSQTLLQAVLSGAQARVLCQSLSEGKLQKVSRPHISKLFS